MLLLGSLLIAVIAGMFIFAYLKQAEYEALRDQHTTEATPAAEEGFAFTRIEAKHYYTLPQGVHTLAGEVMLPTACDLLSTHAVLLDGGTRAVVSFDVINESKGMCAQVETPARFKIGFKAPKDVVIEALSQGKPVELNLIPAGEGESPVDFEVFIKG